MKRKLFISGLVLLAALALAVPVLAGGWAVVTLDALPGEIIAGEQVSIGFTVRQHGRTLVSGHEPTLRLTNPETGKTMFVSARDEGPVGHYLAEFTLPVSGAWRWDIDAFSFPQPMPDLVVKAPAVSTGQTQATPAATVPLVAGISGVVIAGLALAAALRWRLRWAYAVVVLGVLAAGFGFARAGIIPVSARAPLPDKAPAVQPSVVTAAQGEALFVVKGCLTCHRNDRVDERYTVFTTEVGPNLTAYKTSPEYLNLWLTDPSSVKPATEMPNLKLSETEIEALTSFLLDLPAK